MPHTPQPATAENPPVVHRTSPVPAEAPVTATGSAPPQVLWPPSVPARADRHGNNAVIVVLSCALLLSLCSLYIAVQHNMYAERTPATEHSGECQSPLDDQEFDSWDSVVLHRTPPGTRK
ncbi:hypothetical protein FBY35_0472 [Streptomyces sp. SLBN-118]|uniref:hypothetical protein n=1 Tax=Streptomyces sp. SLBN-118 TaxID=2768454 RepID=UPI001154967F|nr:hypothetical protein [Streptomyces sp. SLBN-118]TQK50157.1 hypothetical protein FBY35_0472 [Streptomyces sp. SLBN-118]